MSKTANTRRSPEKAPYFRAYGCERDPFSDLGISGLFFSGGGRQKTVEELLHFARFTRSPLLLLGKAGSGKSTVLKQLNTDADKDVEFAHVEVEIMQSERQLLEAILQGFRQPIPAEGSLFPVFAQWVNSQSARQRYVLLCLDNVHNLSAEFLQPFFELVSQPNSLFRLVLAGEQDARGMLELLSEQFDFSLNAIELEPYDEEGVREYADYRLQSAGYQGDFPFTDLQIKAAQRRSNGNVHQLNVLLRDMLAAGSDYRKRLDFRFPLTNLVVAGGIVAILLVLVLGGQRESQEPEGESALPLSLDTAQSGAADNATVTQAAPEPGDSDAFNSARQQTAQQQSFSANEADASIAVKQPPAEKPLSASVGDDAVNGQAGKASSLTESASTVVLTDKPANIVLATESPHREADGATAVVPDEVAPASEKTDSQTGVVSAATQQSAAATRQAAVRKRLQSWPETGYALQIFGTHNAERARKLVEQYFGQADLLFYETLHNGKPWYVVINGPFSGRQSAQQSIASLPESLQRLRPWPRNIASIKGDVDRYQGILESGR